MNIESIQKDYEQEIQKIELKAQEELTQKTLDDMAQSLHMETKQVMDRLETQTYPKLQDLLHSLQSILSQAEPEEQKQGQELQNEIEKALQQIQNLLMKDIDNQISNIPSISEKNKMERTMQTEPPMAFEIQKKELQPIPADTPMPKAQEPIQTIVQKTDNREPIPMDTPMPRQEFNQENSIPTLLGEGSIASRTAETTQREPQPVPADTLMNLSSTNTIPISSIEKTTGAVERGNENDIIPISQRSNIIKYPNGTTDTEVYSIDDMLIFSGIDLNKREQQGKKDWLKNKKQGMRRSDRVQKYRTEQEKKEQNENYPGEKKVERRNELVQKYKQEQQQQNFIEQQRAEKIQQTTKEAFEQKTQQEDLQKQKEQQARIQKAQQLNQIMSERQQTQQTNQNKVIDIRYKQPQNSNGKSGRLSYNIDEIDSPDVQVALQKEQRRVADNFGTKQRQSETPPNITRRRQGKALEEGRQSNGSVVRTISRKKIS